MFTGIIDATGTILEIAENRLIVSRPTLYTELKIGQSVCISGVCLSIVQFDDTLMRFDLVPETWRLTSFRTKKAGDSVNLERALAVGDRFEGHVVQGHIEGTAVVQVAGETLAVALPDILVPFAVYKGAIAIDGVALTIAKLDQNIYTFALIPHTLKSTTLGSLQPGDSVNIETDILLRWFAHAYGTPKGGPPRAH